MRFTSCCPRLISSVKLTKLSSLLSESYVKACRAAPELTSNDEFLERSTAATSKTETNVSELPMQCLVSIL